MATRFKYKALPTAALGIAVVVFGLGVAGATSVARTSTVPLADSTLVSETSVPSTEVAAAARRARGSRGHGRTFKTFTTAYGFQNASGQTGELVAVDMR